MTEPTQATKIRDLTAADLGRTATYNSSRGNSNTGELILITHGTGMSQFTIIIPGGQVLDFGFDANQFDTVLTFDDGPPPGNIPPLGQN